MQTAIPTLSVVNSIKHQANGSFNMTTDYKAAKESFHAGNLGGSIWSINAVSIVALVSSRDHCYVDSRASGLG